MAVTLVVASGVALALNKIGTNGPDTLTGTNKGDNLLGKGGNDDLYGLGGTDNLLGGPGKDFANPEATRSYRASPATITSMAHRRAETVA